LLKLQASSKEIELKFRFNRADSYYIQGEIMKSDFKIIAIDTTKHWNLAEYPEISKIWEVNYSNFLERTFCAEITPSYCLTPIVFHVEYTPEFDEKLRGPDSIAWDVELRLEVIETMVRSNLDRDVSYYHCNSVYNSPRMKIADSGITQDELDEFGDEVEDYFYEYVTQGGVEILNSRL